MAALLLLADTAAALNCGGRSQPMCVETPPPGVTLNPPAGGNPYGLTPLATPLGPNTPLWPNVRDRKPYGLHAISAERHGTTIAEEAFLGQQLGGSIARIGADWGGIQYFPNASAGGRPWDYVSYIDNKYLALVRQGIRPILAITRTPRRWTTRWNTFAGSNQPGCGTTDACWSAVRSEEAGRLGTFAADLARRYPLAAGIEFWNEPNLANPFWGTDTPNPEYYAALLNVVHDAVKSVRPNMPVIGGGLTTSATDATQNGYPVLSVRTFVRRMLAAGAQDNMDAISLHPYLGTHGSDSVLSWRIRQGSQQLVSAYGDAGKPINERVVYTESGASTTDGWTEARQSDFLSYQYHLVNTSNNSLPLASRTDGMIIHETVENPNPPHGDAWQAGYGFTRVKDGAGRFALKKAYCTFRTLFGGFSSCPAYIDPPG